MPNGPVQQQEIREQEVFASYLRFLKREELKDQPQAAAMLTLAAELRRFHGDVALISNAANNLPRVLNEAARAIK